MTLAETLRRCRAIVERADAAYRADPLNRGACDPAQRRTTRDERIARHVLMVAGQVSAEREHLFRAILLARLHGWGTPQHAARMIRCSGWQTYRSSVAVLMQSADIFEREVPAC